MTANATNRTSAPTFVGVDVGATKTAVAIGTAGGRLCGRRVVATVLRNPERLADQVAATIADLRRDAGPEPIGCVGIGICGGVDRDGLVHGPIALGWSGRVDFARLVSERVGVPAAIDNDVNAGAVAEHRWGAGRGCDDFMYLALGTGIGAGLVLRGEIYRGAHHLAGEIGHLSVDVDGVTCACGNRGCIEASCGGKAAAERLGERLRNDDGVVTSLRGVLAECGDVTTRDLFDHARAGDGFARAEVARMGRHLAAAIVAVVNLLDVERVVVGGGQVQNGVLLAAIRRALGDIRPYLDRGPDLVVPAGLGEDAGVAGALGIAIEAHGRRRGDRGAMEGGRVM